MPKFDKNNYMHIESSKPPAGLKNRLVLTWSPAQQKYNYGPANHTIVNKIGKAEFDKMLGMMTKQQEYAFDLIIEKEAGKVFCYVCYSCACGLCCCAWIHVLVEYGKRLKARKDVLAAEFNRYNKNIFSNKGLKLSCMWAQHGGWWYITDNSPPPMPAKPAPAKPTPPPAPVA
jgi:hypothetical protein